MIVELFYVVFVTIFFGLVVLGRALLFSAIYKCLRADWAIDRRSRKRAIAEATESARVQNIWLFGS